MDVDLTRPTTALTRADAIERTDTDHDAISLSDERSVAASQTSTLDTAASSQMNPLADSKESSQSSIDQYDGDSTSMDLDATERNGTRSNVSSNSTVVPPTDAEAHDAKPMNGVVNGHATDLKHGQKRTASGAVKRPSDRDPSLLKSGSSISHKRTASANTQVNELSAQLRARLSYAMLKVQNGWETRTLDEVEALATQQQGSPMSIASPWRTTGSPKIPQISSTMHNLSPSAATHASNTLNDSLNTDPDTSHINHNSNHSASLSTAYIPPLAPPVDFGAKSNHRRSTVSDRPPPQLANGNGAGRANSSFSSMKSSTSAPLIPITPPLQGTPASTLQTPSQRATASERDAIETLLFMSSPGNSQVFSNGTPKVRPLSQGLHQSPQRPIMSASPQRNRPSSAKQVSFLPISTAAAHAMEAVDRVPLSPRKQGILDNADLETDAGIDRVLDQMPIDGGESSSDESLGSVEAPSERPRASLTV